MSVLTDLVAAISTGAVEVVDLTAPLSADTPILKLPDLFGSQGNGVRGQALVAALCSALTAYLAVRFLMRFFETNTLIPFAVYCVLAGTACTLYFALT